MKTTLCILALALVLSCSRDVTSTVQPAQEKLSFTSPKGFRIAIDMENLRSKIESNAVSAFGKKPFTITSINYTDAANESAALVEFKSSDNEIATVLLLGRFRSSSNGRVMDGGTTKIDCSGKCDSPGQTCRERVTITGGTISYECTCEGSCSMTIEQTDN